MKLLPDCSSHHNIYNYFFCIIWSSNSNNNNIQKQVCTEVLAASELNNHGDLELTIYNYYQQLTKTYKCIDRQMMLRIVYVRFVFIWDEEKKWPIVEFSVCSENFCATHINTVDILVSITISHKNTTRIHRSWNLTIYQQFH